MIEIEEWSLMYAVQAVAAEIKNQRSELDNGNSEPEDFQRLESWERAAEDLERAYNIASRKIINLPPYDELVGS